jgi:hypothetical protein
VGEMVAAHAMLGLEMADHRLDRRAAREGTPNAAVSPRFWPAT